MANDRVVTNRKPSSNGKWQSNYKQKAFVKWQMTECGQTESLHQMTVQDGCNEPITVWVGSSKPIEVWVKCNELTQSMHILKWAFTIMIRIIFIQNLNMVCLYMYTTMEKKTSWEKCNIWT